METPNFAKAITCPKHLKMEALNMIFNDKDFRQAIDVNVELTPLGLICPVEFNDVMTSIQIEVQNTLQKNYEGFKIVDDKMFDQLMKDG